MTKKKKIATIAISLITIFIVIAGVAEYKRYNKKIAEEEAINPGGRTSSGDSVYSAGAEVVDLIGTGIALNGGIASSTSPSEVFQFASSTNDAYWDTNTAYPHRYGATSTAFVLIGNAELMTFEMYFNPANVDSIANCTFQVSNDSFCYLPSPANNIAEWYPMPTEATTTPSDIASQTPTTTIAFSAAKIKHELTIKDVNYECVKLQCSNASTTDASLLHVNMRLR